jgi:SAM-dependent methyltransferase
VDQSPWLDKSERRDFSLCTGFPDAPVHLYLVKAGVRYQFPSPDLFDWSKLDWSSVQRAQGKVLLADDGRDLRSVRDVMSIIHLDGDGIEIGALHFPTEIPRSSSVRYVDYISRELAVAKYSEILDPVNVDIIDDGEVLETIPDKSLDFIVANHMLEHSKDTIGTVNTHIRKLKPGGILFYALPERSQSFDRKRPNTPFAHLVVDHELGTWEGDLLHYREFARLVDDLQGEGAITAKVDSFIATDERIHFHAWDSRATRQLFIDMRRYLGGSFDIVGFYDNGAETINVLRKAE